jgi:hypothetical protein
VSSPVWLFAEAQHAARETDSEAGRRRSGVDAASLWDPCRRHDPNRPNELQSGGRHVTTNPATTQYTTPASLRLERKNSYTLTFVRAGYTKQDLIIEKQMRTGVLIADIILFPIGVIVDAITGAWYRLTPSPVSVQLQKTTGDVEGPDTISITLRASDDGKDLLLESSVPVTVEVHSQS